jgi:cytochrome c-type biogenesis protein CcmH/NrfG
LIWLVIVAVVFVGGGSFLVAKKWRTRGIVFFAGLAAALVYLIVGKPEMPDEPLAGRLADIEKRIQNDPNSMTLADAMALAQKRAQDAPKDAMPHFIMGQILEQAGQANEALMAYESAMRRDPSHIPTLTNIADLRFRLTGGFDEATTELYHRVYKAEPDNWRAGYFAGVGDWLNGRKDEAEALWTELEARNPPPEMKQMFAAFQETFKIVRQPANPAQTQRSPG